MICDYPTGAIEGLVGLKFVMAMVVMVFARSLVELLVCSYFDASLVPDLSKYTYLPL